MALDPEPLERFAREAGIGPADHAHIDLHGKNGRERVEAVAIHGGDLILPSGGVSILECAKRAFTVFAMTYRYFVRGRLVTEIGRDKHGNEMLIQVKPSGLRTRLEEHFQLKAWRCAKKADVAAGIAVGDPILKEANCTKDIAEALLDSNPAIELTPGIRVMVRSPIITEVGGCLKVLEHGYYSELGGVYVSNKLEIPEVPLREAVPYIRSLLAEFDFVTLSDLSRAVAAIISPALRFGQLLKCDFPIDFSEADFSQSGKSLRQKMICAIYDETAYVITKEEKGVGSFGESISSGLIGALPFIAIENIRDKVDSQLLESAIKGMGVVNCRVPYKGEVQVTTDHVCWQLSSNKASPTPDLANRSIITRIRKRPGHQFKTYEDGDIIAHIKANQPHALGCVFSIIRTWFNFSKYAGRKLRTDDTRHDFREWSQTLDWIVQEIFGLPPLLDGHQEEQERVSDPTLMWLRDVAINVKKSNRLDEKFRPSEIVDLCDAYAIDIPGCRVGLSPEQIQMVVGKNLRRLFKDTDKRTVTGIYVTHSGGSEYNPKRQENFTVNFYEFSDSE